MQGNEALGVANHRVHQHHLRFEIPVQRLGRGPFDVIITLIGRRGAETSVRRRLLLG